MKHPLSAALIGAVALTSAVASLGAAAQTPHPQMHPMPAAPAGAAVAATSVQIHDFAFAPATIIVAPGAAVTWTNADDEPHTITANDHSYHSAALDTHQAYTRTFAAPGEYRYFCSLHPQMTGVVIVRAPGAG